MNDAVVLERAPLPRMTILSLLGLALADALNPFSIGSLILLLSTDRPMARGWVFVAGTLGVYIPFGILLAEGWTAAFAALLPLLPIWLIGGVLAAAGFLCIGLAWHLSSKDRNDEPDQSLSKVLSLPATAAFAVASTMADAPTAVPFFAAAALIPDLAVGRAGQYAWVILYCLVYVAPLLLLLALRAALGVKGASMIERVQKGVYWSFRHLLPPLLVLGGGVLCWLGASFL